MRPTGSAAAGRASPSLPTPKARRNVPTGIETKLFDSLGRTLTTVPEGLTVHKTLGRVLDAKREMFTKGEGFDWATAEALAFGSLVSEGYSVRLSGQDSGRGTFSHRHAVWVDQNDEHKYVPLTTVPHGHFEVHDSTLSEYGVLGFEYGYASADPKTLVLWEAQFGDFANGAQIVIDQYIASSESKWLRANGLVMLLPHGYEGQGPEHSSARLERYLQLCAEDNMQVCNITSPANYFHVLRRQMHRQFRKPLIIMAPRACCATRWPSRRPRSSRTVTSSASCRTPRPRRTPTPSACALLGQGGLRSDGSARCRRHHRHADRPHRADLSLPRRALAARLAKMRWKRSWVPGRAQEQRFLVLRRAADRGSGESRRRQDGRARYAGRHASASPATGSAKRHTLEQGALVADALGLSVSEIRRQQKG
jgi:2-oxoglutarate dehydrogenase E1 component